MRNRWLAQQQQQRLAHRRRDQQMLLSHPRHQRRRRYTTSSLLLLLLAVTVPSSAAASCGLAELACRAGHCVPVDSYCNGVDDCGDGSDEPPLCTPCNRTYHGQEGRTYRLDLPRPAEGRLPFLCHLTFTASGQGHGELVQLLWDAFSVGRLDAAAKDIGSSCPEGSMQLAELGRPFPGGSWCGPGEGRASYYSETSTVTASIRLFAAPSQVPFEFRLRYRFVSRPEAVARLGTLEAPIERGSPVPGTYCSRNFYECYQKSCRVQSPNYPGEYPRNASCLVTLRQREVPTCKHAMMSVKSASGSAVQSNSSLAVWNECPASRDRIVIRDGSRVDDPVLLIYCGGPLPRITARGSSMLVEFSSSEAATPLGAAALRLELESQVVYVDSDGLDYAQTPQGCYFTVNGTQKRSGVLRAPLHALPPGTNCTWSARGQPGDRIWLYFASYAQRDLRGRLAPGNATSRDESQRLLDSEFTSACLVRLSLWDGAPAAGLQLASLCDETPKLCAHAALRNATRSTRPCTADESYLTVAPSLTIRMESVGGTALNTVNFNARYEFISTVQGGEHWGEDNLPCSRIWRRVKAGQVQSPRDLRLFGRGGARTLDCRYRVEAAAGERVKLTIHSVSLGDATACSSEPDPHTGRPRCAHDYGSRVARLAIFESPWKDVRLPRACLCDNTSSLLPMTHVTSGRAIEMSFFVERMSPDEDFDALHFNASFELIKAPECPRKQRVRGEGGELRFVSPPLSRPDIYCDGLPWLVEARENRSLFVLTYGWLLPSDPSAALNSEPTSAAGENAKCPTTNRLLLYSGWPPRLHKIVCPAEPGTREYTVHVFSEEWLGADDKSVGLPSIIRSPALLFDFVAREPGQSAASWLEISKSRSALRSQLRLLPEREIGENGSLTRDCPHKCPELGACIAPSLWCDGRVHCPSGFDEADCGSGARLLGLLPSVTWLLLAAAAGILTAFACLFTILISRSKARAKRLQYTGTTTKTKKTKKEKGSDGKKGPRRAGTEETLLGSSSPGS